MSVSQTERRRFQRVYRGNNRRRSTKILETITEETATTSGGDFFRSLLSQLVKAYHVRRAFITECTDHTFTRVRTIALFEANRFQENIEYDLSGTPCQGVIGGAACYYPTGLERLFIKAVGMDAYLGFPLRSSMGLILGHLALVDDRPMNLSQDERAMLKIFADRAAMELERAYREEALRDSDQQLRLHNAQLADYNRSLEEKVSERLQEIRRRRSVAESLRTILAALNASDTLQDIVSLIALNASMLLGNPTAVLYSLDARTPQFVPQSVSGAELGIFAGNDMLAGWHERIRKGESVAVGSMISETQPGEVFRALLVIPLYVELDVSGCLALFYREERSFSKEDIDLAQTFGDQVSLIIEYAALRQRVRQTAVIEERARLARDLHDSVSQSLYSLGLLAEGWQRQVRLGKMSITPDQLAEIGEIAQQALKEMRLLVFELRPSALEQEGLAGALQQRLNSVEKRAGVSTQLEVLPADLMLPAVMEEGLYRIAQEALNNVLKHSAASRVTVRIQAGAGALVMEISDNGRGFKSARKEDRGGIGLAIMRERAEKLGGMFELHSAPDNGTMVRIRCPYAKSNE